MQAVLNPLSQLRQFYHQQGTFSHWLCILHYRLNGMFGFQAQQLNPQDIFKIASFALKYRYQNPCVNKAGRNTYSHCENGLLNCNLTNRMQHSPILTLALQPTKSSVIKNYDINYIDSNINLVLMVLWVLSISCTSPYKSTAQYHHCRPSHQPLWDHTPRTSDTEGSCKSLWHTYHTAGQCGMVYSYTVLFLHHKLCYRQSRCCVHTRTVDSQELGHDHRYLANRTHSWDQQY